LFTACRGLVIAPPYRIQSDSIFDSTGGVGNLASKPIMTQGNDAVTEPSLANRILRASSAALLACVLTVTSAAVSKADDGIVKIKSAYSVDETIERLKRNLAAKGIRFVSEADQSSLAANAGVTQRPTTLLVFGKPSLGTLLLPSSSNSGLDWPLRLLVIEDEQGDVYAVYTDYDWIAKRHGIACDNEQFEVANRLVASIAASVQSV